MILKVRDISKSFSEHKILKKLNLDLETGKIYVLVGKSGIGKTLFFNIIGGSVLTDTGSIQFSFAQDRKVNISRVYQEPRLFSWLSIRDNLKICAHENQSLIDQMLEEFGLADYRDHYPHQLSGGMNQRISIIRSFINESELVLMDEPLAHIDEIQKQEYIKLTKELHVKRKNTVFIITHNLHEALALGDEVIVMSKSTSEMLHRFPLIKDGDYVLSRKYVEDYQMILKSINDES